MLQIRAYRWGLFLLLTVTVVVIAAICVFKTFSLPPTIPTFNPPGCVLPCLAGITPGETEISLATALITSSLPYKLHFFSYGGLSFRESPSGNLVYLDFDRIDPREGNYVKQIEASTRGKGKVTTLGVMMGAGFTPTRVFRGRVSGPDSISLLIVFGADQQIIANVGATKMLSPETPIDDLITIAKESWILDDIRAVSHFDDEISWLGFALVDTYWNASPKN